MDSEKRARRQSFRIILSETIMVLSVVILVTILALLVSGYWLNSDFEIERQGMLQVNSTPTGANVEVDGDAPWYQRTNTSKVLPIGEHTVTLTKNGYDSWSKTVNIREGLLYRLRYPRLFLLERKKDTVYESPTATFVTVSKNSATMVLINNTSMWTVLNLEDEKLEPKNLDISALFDSVSKAEGATTGLFTGTIVGTSWSGDNEHLLIQSKNNEATEWVLIDIKNPNSSINLTRAFGTDFKNVRIFNNSASSLLALRDGKLYKISVPERQISSVIVSNVVSFDFYDQDIIYTAKNTETENYDVGIIRIGEEPTIIESSTTPLRAYLSRFYDDKFITFISSDTITIKKHDELEDYATKTLEFNPEQIKIAYDGSFIFMKTGKNVEVFDMEALSLVTWTLDSESYGWLTDEMPYSIREGTLVVYDFDGANRRPLSSNISGHFPATITSSKWLYYFSDDALIREKIAD